MKKSVAEGRGPLPMRSNSEGLMGLVMFFVTLW